MSEGFFCSNGGNQSCKCEWVWEEKLRWLIPRWPNSKWQNSRWLPSSSWVRMNEFESDWISLSQSQSGGRVLLSESERRKQGVWIQNAKSWIQVGRIQDGCHHHQVKWEWMSLIQIELVWVRVRVEGECFWVNLREDNQVSESKMTVSETNNIVEFKMAAIIKLSQNEWMKVFCANGGEGSVSEVFFVQMVGTNHGNYEFVWEEKLRWLNPRWWNTRWQNSRWPPSSR